MSFLTGAGHLDGNKKSPSSWEKLSMSQISKPTNHQSQILSTTHTVSPTLVPLTGQWLHTKQGQHPLRHLTGLLEGAGAQTHSPLCCVFYIYTFIFPLIYYKKPQWPPRLVPSPCPGCKVLSDFCPFPTPTPSRR